jgi:hypothetical protein
MLGAHQLLCAVAGCGLEKLGHELQLMAEVSSGMGKAELLEPGTRRVRQAGRMEGGCCRLEQSCTHT